MTFILSFCNFILTFIACSSFLKLRYLKKWFFSFDLMNWLSFTFSGCLRMLWGFLRFLPLVLLRLTDLSRKIRYLLEWTSSCDEIVYLWWVINEIIIRSNKFIKGFKSWLFILEFFSHNLLFINRFLGISMQILIKNPLRLSSLLKGSSLPRSRSDVSLLKRDFVLKRRVIDEDLLFPHLFNCFFKFSFLLCL